jgi:MFS family permease
VLLGVVVADRLDRPALLVISDMIRGLGLGALALLTATDIIALWHVVVGAIVYGAGDALFVQVLGALVPVSVPHNQLLQANSLNQFVRLLGLKIAGSALVFCT